MFARLTVALALLPAAMVLAPQQPRDGATTATGTAIISGTVVVDESTSRPLGRAILTISGAAVSESRSAITDDTGAFAIRDLPPGRFTITATKPGYVAGTFGATRPGRPGTPVQLAAGQALAVRVHLAPGAVIAGSIRDAAGDPIPGLFVFAVDARKDPATVGESLMTNSGRSGGTAGAVTTDDRGEYRIFGLSPGEYVVLAAAQSRDSTQVARRSTAEVDALLIRLQARAQSATIGGVAAAAANTKIVAAPTAPFTVAPVYFPGTPSLDGATHLTLMGGDERVGVDFVMSSVPVTTIDGIVAGDDGQPPANAQLSITPANAIRLFALATAAPVLTAPPDSTGHFRFSNLVPGHYVIMARGNPTGSLALGGGRGGRSGVVGSDAGSGGTATPDATRTLYGIEEVDVNGQPVTGLTIHLQRGGRFAGRVEFDATSHSMPADLTQLRLTLSPASGSGYLQSGATLIGNPFGGMGAVPIRADGSFDIPGIAPGSYRVQCTLPPAAGTNWWFRSALVRGRDVLDTVLDIPLGADFSGAVLTMTDRHSELSGHLQTATGQPAPDYTVIVLPTDRALWGPGARRVKSTRPGTDGAFSFADLPAGDYLLAALTDVEPNEWQKPDFLAQVAPLGVKVSIGQGEKKTQDLQIARR